MLAKTIYRTTDLCLCSAVDLTPLAGEFESHGVPHSIVTHGDDGKWYATLSTGARYAEPELTIAEMVAVVESLAEPHLTTWQSCSKREFNLGYDCGTEPWAFEQALSCELLGRVHAIGASLGLTLYACREEEDGES